MPSVDLHETPQVGWIYGALDRLSRYRVQVVAIDERLLRAGKRGIQLRNINTGRHHWTSQRQLRSGYRLCSKEGR